jgi:hypothetical protein
MDKKLLIMGAGAGTGVLVPVLMRKYIDPKYPAGVAGIKLSVLVPIVTGAAGIGIGMFTKLIKNDTLNNFIIMYGFTAIFGGIATYATENFRLLGGRGIQMQNRGGNQYMGVQNPYQVTSRVPSVQNYQRRVGTGIGGVAGGVIYS